MFSSSLPIEPVALDERREGGCLPEKAQSMILFALNYLMI